MSTIQSIRMQLIEHTNIWICVILLIFLPINAQQYQTESNHKGYRRTYISAPTIVTNEASGFVKFPDDEQENSHITSPDVLRPIPATAATNGNYYESHKKRAENANVIANNARRSQTCTTCADPQVEAIQRSLLEVTRDALDFDDLYKILDNETLAQLEIISPRFGGEEVERSFSKRAQAAICKPELTVVPLKLIDSNESKDPTIVVVPSCTRVNRCGGCCSTSLLSCQPIESVMLQFEVSKIRHVNGKPRSIHREIIPVEEHTRCHCECITKPSDCNRLQTYSKEECSCKCKNSEDQYKCVAEEKIWDRERCLCRCRDECSTGLDQDPITCKCVATSDRRRLITKPVIYVQQTPETFYNSDT